MSFDLSVAPFFRRSAITEHIGTTRVGSTSRSERNLFYVVTILVNMTSEASEIFLGGEDLELLTENQVFVFSMVKLKMVIYHAGKQVLGCSMFFIYLTFSMLKNSLNSIIAIVSNYIVPPNRQVIGSILPTASQPSSYNISRISLASGGQAWPWKWWTKAGLGRFFPGSFGA